MDGHPNAQTPNLDRLAAQSTLFTNAHCQAPICGPSRSSLLSGFYPHSTGIYGHINFKGLQENTTVKKTRFLPEYFADHGYKTMGVGKIYHSSQGEETFQEFGGKMGGFGPKPAERMNYTPTPFKGNGTSTDWGAFPDTDEKMPDFKVAAWAVEKIQEKHDQPFFLAAGFYRPHVPWHVPQPWFDQHPLESVQEPEILDEDLNDLPPISKQVHEMTMMPSLQWMRENNEIGEATQAYLASVTFVDHQVGKLLDALDASPYAENTIVVLFSDHGYHLGEKHRWAKFSLWEESTHVPLMVRLPGQQAGAVCKRPAGLIDLYPTLAELCGLPPNPLNQGHSLKPLLLQPNAIWERPALTTYGRNNHAIRTDRYRYIRYEDGAEELYDHHADPNEWHNLAERPELETLKQSFRHFLPKENVPWDPNSHVRYNAYFEKHMAENQ
jgi:arylsulfatase A-like enzyme